MWDGIEELGRVAVVEVLGWDLRGEWGMTKSYDIWRKESGDSVVTSRGLVRFRRKGNTRGAYTWKKWTARLSPQDVVILTGALALPPPILTPLLLCATSLSRQPRHFRVRKDPPLPLQHAFALRSYNKQDNDFREGRSRSRWHISLTRAR